MKHRFTTCLLLGVLAGAVLSWFSAKYRHVQLVAAAAKAHHTAGGMLVIAFCCTAVVVTVVTFAVASIAARNRSRSQRPQAAGARRSGRGAGYSPGPGWSEW